jgi:hypothetical protein
MNPLAMLAAAQRSQAAYIEDLVGATAAFLALGNTVLGQYKNETHQAILSKDSAGLFYLSISGTRFSEPDNVDILDDVYLAPVPTPKGGQVSAGVASGMQDFWDWVWKIIPSTSTINLEGHSLGAERVLLSPVYLPKEQIGDIYAFEPPQFATQAYWDAYRDELSGAIQTVCGSDIWFNYPPDQGYVHDHSSQVYWLQPDSIELIYPFDWKGGLSTDDHAIAEVITCIQAGITNASFPQ